MGMPKYTNRVGLGVPGIPPGDGGASEKDTNRVGLVMPKDTNRVGLGMPKDTNRVGLGMPRIPVGSD